MTNNWPKIYQIALEEIEWNHNKTPEEAQQILDEMLIEVKDCRTTKRSLIGTYRRSEE